VVPGALERVPGEGSPWHDERLKIRRHGAGDYFDELLIASATSALLEVGALPEGARIYATTSTTHPTRNSQHFRHRQNKITCHARPYGGGGDPPRADAVVQPLMASRHTPVKIIAGGLSPCQ